MVGRGAFGGSDRARWSGSVGTRPLVRFLVHGAERSGPPIYALRLVCEWARRPPPFRTELIVASPGPLVAEFDKATTTRTARLDSGSPERRAQRRLADLGLSVASGALLEAATRARVHATPAELTVVNGATAPTVELLEALPNPGRVVTVAHELSTGWFANLSSAQRDLLLARTSAFLAVSESVRSFLHEQLEVAETSITVIPPPVDRYQISSCFTDRSSTALIAGMGVTDWRKAPESWLRVAHLARARSGRTDLRFVWVGGSPLSSHQGWPLEHEMRHLDLQDCTRFTGTIAAPWNIIGSADVMVSTAREDAYPLACAEAISLGIPVVGYDVDGVGEMVRASGCGMVVPYPDDAAIADAVVKLLDDTDLRSRMSDHGREYARHHLAVEQVAPQIADWLMGHIP